MRSHTASTALRFSAPRQPIAARGRLVCNPTSQCQILSFRQRSWIGCTLSEVVRGAF
jgi:hypothetical protein